MTIARLGVGSAGGKPVVITALGLTQILAWGSTYYLPAVLAAPIAADTGWPLSFVVGGLSAGLLIAGIVSPRVGRMIATFGGRPVLAASAVALAAGLTVLALAPNLPVYFVAWLLLGVGMGAGLYDAAFATLGRLYGQTARQAITTLTLFGGFASTVCWPLSAALVTALGWRGACLTYAGLHLGLALPLYLFALPREVHRDVRAAPGDHAPVPVISSEHFRLVLALVAGAITLGSAVSATLSVHLLTVLQDRGVTLVDAVALGAIVGPSQVGARVIEMVIGRYHHPIWTMVASVVFLIIGVGALWAQLPLTSLTLVFYGAGIGIESIARGTLPLALFGHARYAVLMGQIALPSLVAQALAPFIGAFVLASAGDGWLLGLLTGTAAAQAFLVFLLMWTRRTSDSIECDRSN